MPEQTTDHLKEAKKALGRIEDGACSEWYWDKMRDYEPQVAQAHALIAIAERLERIAVALETAARWESAAI